MKNNKFLFLILFLLAIASCNTNQKSVVIQEKKLVLVDSVDIDFLFNIRDLIKKEHYLIISNNRTDSIFIIYDWTKKQIIQAFGKRGKGIHEYVFPNLVMNEEHSPYFYIKDIGRKRITKINVHNINDISEFPYDLDKIPLSMVVINDSLCLFDTFNPDLGLIIKANFFNHKSKIIYRFDDLKNKFNESSFYYGFLGYNFKNKLIVYVYMRLSRIDILSTEGVIIKKTDHTKYKELNQKNLLQNNITYNNIYFDDKYIYAVKTDGKEMDIIQNPEHFRSAIECYNWNGELLSVYHSNRFIHHFFIDEKDNLVYIIDDTKNAYQLEIYRIND